MDKELKYKRNWAFEQMADVHFLDGHSETLHCQTNNKGQIEWLHFNDTYISPERFTDYGITEVHFMTPAKLEVKQSVDMLVQTYLDLGESIAEGDTKRKVAIRSNIEQEIRKRGLNMHDEMARCI